MDWLLDAKEFLQKIYSAEHVLSYEGSENGRQVYARYLRMKAKVASGTKQLK